MAYQVKEKIYKRSTEDKYKPIVDEYTRPVVDDIYKYYLNYCSITELAKILDARDILNPISYRRKLKDKPINTDSHCCNATVRSIFAHPIYTGDMVQGRTKPYSH